MRRRLPAKCRKPAERNVDFFIDEYKCAEYVLGCPSVAFAHPGKPTSSDLAPPARGAGRRGLGERMDDARREADQRGSAPKGTEGREAR